MLTLNLRKIYEFGTKEFPYKSTFFAAKEIFNSVGSEDF